MIVFPPDYPRLADPFWWRLSNFFLLLASLLFFYWGEKSKVWIFVGTTFVDYLSALLISRALFTPDFLCETPGFALTFQEKR